MKLLILSILFGAVSADAQSFADWLSKQPNGFFKYVYEAGDTGGACGSTFCAPSYNGNSVTLNCHDTGASHFVSFEMTGPKDALTIQFNSLLQNKPVSVPLDGNGHWEASESSSHIYDLSYTGQVDGDTATVTFDESIERYDPYLGWYAYMEYKCTNIKGGYDPAKSSIIPDPDPSGDWSKILGSGNVSLNSGGGMSGVIVFENQAPQPISGVSALFKIDGHVPDQVKIHYVGGYGFPKGLVAETTVDSAKGSFDLNWRAGYMWGEIKGRISSLGLYIEKFDQESSIPSWNKVINQEPVFFSITN